MMDRRKLWKAHSWLGLAAGLPMLLIALTGSLLVFKDELNGILMTEQVVVEPTAQGRWPVDRLHRKAIELLPDYQLAGWVLSADPGRADALYVIAFGDSEWRKLFLDPYRGELLSEPQSLTHYLTDWLVNFHYTFLGGHLGMLVVGLLSLMLMALGVLGFYIYRRFWIGFFRLRWGKSLRVLMGDLHSRIGVISSPVFFILGLTGAYWNLTHAVADLAEHGLFHEHSPLQQQLYDSELSLQEMITEADRQLPGFQVNYLAFPTETGWPITLYGAVPTANPLRGLYGSQVWFDASTGERQGVTDVRARHWGIQFVDMFEPLHFGNFGGLAVKLIWCILGLMPGLLAVSGFIVWLKRRRTLKGRESCKPRRLTIGEAAQ